MDEFSDFQMAVGSHSGSKNNEQNKKNGLWILEQSPVNPTFNQSNSIGKSRNVFVSANNVQFIPFANSSPSVSQPSEKRSVGSRLANYNLGIKSSTQTESSIIVPESQNNRDSILRAFESIQLNSTNHQSNYSFNQNPSLLMGEEDKYAALRVLVNADVQSPEDFPSDQNILHCEEKSSQKSKEPSQFGVEVSTFESDFGDFGDFQSFTCVNSLSNQHNSLKIDGNDCSGSSNPFKNGYDKNNILNCQSSCSLDNLTNESSWENDFGDFVSVKQPAVTLQPCNLSENIGHPINENFSERIESNWKSKGVSMTLSENEWLSKPQNLVSRISKSSDDSKLHKPTTDFSRNTIDTFICNDFLGSIKEIKTSNSNSLKIVSLEPELQDSSTSDVAGCASINDINNDSLDYAYFGQKDVFSSCSTNLNTSLDISPESRSIASLDLGNYCNTSDFCDNVKSAEQSVLYNTGIFSDKDNVLGLPIIASKIVEQCDHSDTLHSASQDRYQCFKDEVDNVRDKSFSDWIRCLESCKLILSQANELFNDAPCSDVIREIISEEQGYGYVLDLIAVYRVYLRIRNSMKKNGVTTNQIVNLSNEIQNAWEILISFFLGTAVLELMAAEDGVQTKQLSKQQTLCELCKNEEDTFDDLIDYGGTVYHSSCANLWINVVETSACL